MMRMPSKLFAVAIEGPSWSELERSLLSQREGSSPFWMVTANPEILLEARKDVVYRHVLTQADVRTVDGMGLWLALRLRGVTTTRLTGVELAEHLLQMAQERGWKVALIGGIDPERARTAVQKLQIRYPRIQFCSEQGGHVTREGEVDDAGEEACHRLTLEEPDLLLVAFGHPRQERWLARYLHTFPSVRVAVGIGGTIDFWAEAITRAPMVLRRLGLEWVWRLWQEPRRLPRILRAVIVFPSLVLWDSIKEKGRIFGRR